MRPFHDTGGATSALAALVLGIVAVAGSPLSAQEAEGKKKVPPITVEAVLVQPENPGPETLCKLRVRLKNRADRSVSAFGFQVKVNGHELSVYEKQRYLEALAPGETREISLFNFWSTETDRPTLKGGSLQVEVSLVEARWVDMTMEDKIPVWTLQEPVKDLPSTASAKKPFTSK